jgi:hypothetical protein
MLIYRGKFTNLDNGTLFEAFLLLEDEKNVLTSYLNQIH